jgi:hypothetical protein
MKIDPNLFAYVGPGAGLDLIGSVIALVATFGTSVFFLLMWPVRSFLRRIRGTADVADEVPSNS